MFGPNPTACTATYGGEDEAGRGGGGGFFSDPRNVALVAAIALAAIASTVSVILALR